MTFDIALTGINAASTQLETISNNIANNATTGFKRSRASFADVYAVSTFGATNPAVGQGVRISGITQEFHQGDTTFTNNNLDLSVEGLGMFRLMDNGSPIYTRAGNFALDREGFIVNASGNRLTGYRTNNLDQIEPIADDLRIDYSDLQPRASTTVELSMNLDIKDPVLPPFDVTDASTFNFSTSTTVYDSLGSAQLANVYFHKDAPNTWSTFTYVDGVEISQVGGDELVFDTSGLVQSVNGSPGGDFTTNTYTPVSNAEPMSLTFQLQELTQFDNSFGVNKVVQDGYAAGRLEDFDVDPGGIIFGRFSNGQAKTMGQITLTTFPNLQGLRQIGDTSWTETFSSGEPATGEPGSASLGQLQAGSLEGSNVDITQELVSMIGAQRSFQANAQVISTGDTLTQTVINIRR
ncbi:MAG: flagellar hook protein FlgE [Granulosicoccus sp.]|nr:flagellar hook protein FlgE [Granulosicoccus sp.]